MNELQPWYMDLAGYVLYIYIYNQAQNLSASLPSTVMIGQDRLKSI